MAKRTMLPFHRVAEAPRVSGVYAWYSHIQLMKRDLQLCIERVEAAPANERGNLVREFLDRRIFSKFREADYQIKIYGKLKPKYSGVVQHDSRVSDSLVNRIVESPNLLFELADVLNATLPEFSSPIYIGSSVDIAQRLATHARLIRRYKESSVDLDTETIATETADADHSFAWEAIQVRRLEPEDLWVSILPTKLTPELTIPLENLLNRINYPLCGRN